MDDAGGLSAEMVERLAAHGGVSLRPDRAAVVAEVYAAFIAPELARVMSAEVDVLPAVMFHVEAAEAGFARPLSGQGG